MNFRLALDIASFPQKINHRHKLFLSGSCFTEHITKQLSNNKFTTIENPNGILFNPASIAASIVSYMEEKMYGEKMPDTASPYLVNMLLGFLLVLFGAYVYWRTRSKLAE